MNEHAVDIVVFCKFQAHIEGTFVTDGVWCCTVNFHKFSRVVVNVTECIGINGTNDVDALALETFVGVAQVRPASDTFENDAVFFLRP